MSKDDLLKDIKEAMRDVGIEEILESLGERLGADVSLDISEEDIDASDLVPLVPFGLMSGQGLGSPVFIFKDDSEESTMPIPLGALQASIIALALGPQIGSSVFGLSKKLFKKIDLEFDRVVFDRVEDSLVLAKLFYSIAGKLSWMRLTAEEALAFALETQAEFFATEEVLIRAKSLELERNMSESSVDPQMEEELRTQKYLI